MSDSMKFWDLQRSQKEGQQEVEVDNLTLCVPMQEPGQLRNASSRRAGRYSTRQTGMHVHAGYTMTI